jgi:hypothetical protein
MKKLLYYVLTAILLCGCGQREKSKDSATATDAMWQFDDQEIATWEQWFKDNHRRYVHLFGSDSISPSHNDAIDDLISLFYNGNDTLRHDYRMILWRLNEFYPINNENVDGYERYLGVEKQVDSLLNFNTNLDYLVRRKSALARLMYEFRIRMFEDVLAGSMKKTTKALFEEERKAWNEYQNATSEAFGINVLRKESYNFKAVFWNNYDFDIMDHRLKSLLYMCFKNPAIYSETAIGDWDSVERGYIQLIGLLDSMDNPDYDYSYDEKMEALTKDEEAFKDYMDIHEDLLDELRISDKNYQLYMKEQALIKFHAYDHIERFEK